MMQESTNPKDALGRLKPDLTAIPPVALVHAALAMMDGTAKYGPYNWRDKTVSARTYLAANQRHVLAYLDGEKNAKDSGIHHLGHAIASLCILLDAETQGTLVDDRPKAGKTSESLEKFTKIKDNSAQMLMGVSTPKGLRWNCSIRVYDKTASHHHTSYDVVDETGEFFLGNVTGMWQLFMPGMGRWGMFTSAGEAILALNKCSISPPLNRPQPPITVYIAGPMRGYAKFNFPSFDKARDLAKKLGFTPISPADLDRNSGFNENSPPMDATTPEITREFVRRDSDALLSMRKENGDAIALLPGWEKSTGALAEFFMARWLGLKVLNAETMEPFGPCDFVNKDLSFTLGSAAYAYTQVK